MELPFVTLHITGMDTNLPTKEMTHEIRGDESLVPGLVNMG